MLKKLMDGFRALIGASGGQDPYVVPRNRHSVSRSGISSSALKVLYRLNKHGYEAYLVGGGIRDLLLGHIPKDFDVATNAKPWEVKKLFSNCRLIGRRFRLAHVYFNEEIIEVATFRAGDLESNQIVTRDNVYGEITDDVWRRDFTINSLYYNIADFSIVDYCGGLKDIENRVIRIIGDPVQRYHEDPVRMIRAIRFAAKLNFTIETKTADAIRECKDLLEKISSARLFEEFKKLFLTGAGKGVFKELNNFGFVELLFPETYKYIDNEAHLNFISSALQETDYRVAHAKTLNPAFIFAVLLWPSLKFELDSQKAHHSYEKMLEVMRDVINRQKDIVAISKYQVASICDIWMLQFQMAKPNARNAEKIFSHSKYRAAYDFMCIRYEEYSIQDKTLTWWQTYMDADQQQRWAMVKSLKGKKRYKKKKDRKSDGKSS
jgi:poly(A) polymerase